jgi:hypothetical protein
VVASASREAAIARSRHPGALLGLVLAAGLACGWPASDGGLAPIGEPSLDMDFSAPVMLTVRPGDTLAVLAKRNGVSVADLKSWNGLDSDTIEVDQILLVWAPAPKPVAVRPPAATGLRATLDSVLGTAPAPSPNPVAVAAPVADAPAPAPVAIQLPEGRVSIARPALVGLLGMEAGPGVDLEAAAAGMSRHDADLGGGGLGERSLSAGSSADDLELAERRQRHVGPQIPNTPVSAPRLAKPAAKRCLGGPSGTIREDGVAISQGLTAAQINAGMGQIARHVVRCFPAGTSGGFSMLVEITAGCDGRVSNVFVNSAGSVPANVASCVEQTLAFASFPAHAVPNGVEFQYPMKFTF